MAEDSEVGIEITAAVMGDKNSSLLIGDLTKMFQSAFTDYGHLFTGSYDEPLLDRFGQPITTVEQLFYVQDNPPDGEFRPLNKGEGYNSINGSGGKLYLDMGVLAEAEQYHNIYGNDISNAEIHFSKTIQDSKNTNYYDVIDGFKADAEQKLNEIRGNNPDYGILTDVYSKSYAANEPDSLFAYPVYYSHYADSVDTFKQKLESLSSLIEVINNEVPSNGRPALDETAVGKNDASGDIRLSAEDLLIILQDDEKRTALSKFIGVEFPNADYSSVTIKDINDALDVNSNGATVSNDGIDVVGVLLSGANNNQLKEFGYHIERFQYLYPPKEVSAVIDTDKVVLASSPNEIGQGGRLGI